VSRPQPVRDLDWDAGQARELTGAVLDLWAELLERMRELPVARPARAADVAREMALPVPEQPLAVAELADLLRPLVLEHSTLCGHPGFMAYFPANNSPRRCGSSVTFCIYTPGARPFVIFCQLLPPSRVR